MSTPLEALTYEAPFLIEKLLKERIVTTPEEGRLLFREALRYLVLCASLPTPVDMYSRRIDEVWHQFILFTREYDSFCQRFFGGFLHHHPGLTGASGSSHVPSARIDCATFESFRASYQSRFGEPLPGVWFDLSDIHAGSFLVHGDSFAELEVKRTDDLAVLSGRSAGSETFTSIFAVNDLAGSALDFVRDHNEFFVRELPGGLTALEQIALAELLGNRRVVFVKF